MPRKPIARKKTRPVNTEPVLAEGRAAEFAKNLDRKNARAILNDEILARQMAAIYRIPFKAVKDAARRKA